MRGELVARAEIAAAATDLAPLRQLTGTKADQAQRATRP